MDVTVPFIKFRPCGVSWDDFEFTWWLQEPDLFKWGAEPCPNPQIVSAWCQVFDQEFSDRGLDRGLNRWIGLRDRRLNIKAINVTRLAIELGPFHEPGNRLF